MINKIENDNNKKNPQRLYEKSQEGIRSKEDSHFRNEDQN